MNAERVIVIKQWAVRGIDSLCAAASGSVLSSN